MSDNISLEKELVNSLLSDRRRERVWRNIRFVVYACILLGYLSLFLPKLNVAGDLKKEKPYVSLVRLNGEIDPTGDFSARKVIPQLTAAFMDKRAKGVILLINSPGGSPVQASIIHDKIEQLKTKYHKTVIVMGEDLLASGAYLISTAADKIYVNDDTVTGSIGVIMDGFGFSDLMHKIGIDRRVFTAGDNKDRMDPFLPMNPADKAKLKIVLDDVHQNFIDDVEAGRKGKLNGDPKELFSGDFWTGQEAVKLGLVDGTGNLWDVAKKEFNVQRYKDYSRQPGLLEILLRGASESLHLPALGLLAPNAPIKTELPAE